MEIAMEMPTLTRIGLEGRLIIATVFNDLPSLGIYGFSNNLTLACSDEDFQQDLHSNGFIIPCIQSTYARVGLTINKPIKDAKGYVVNAFPFLYTNDDIDNVVHSQLLNLLQSNILIAIKRQDEMYVKKGQLKFAKIYANFSALDDLTPVTQYGTPSSLPVPDEFVTDNGL